MKVSDCSKRPILIPCGLNDFNHQIDPYVGCEHYCYYCYVLPQAETDWSKEILIHEDIIRQLEQELAAVPPQTIYMGYHTDPYQPCEAQYLQTRKVLELLLNKGFSVSILTKSDLVVRDIDILKKMPDAAVSVSVAFKDNQTRSRFEANTMDTERRIQALSQLKQSGVRTGAMLCPMIPYITDPVQLIDMVQPYAEVMRIYRLSISDPSSQSWQNVQRILKNNFSDLADQIKDVVSSENHEYWIRLREKLEKLQHQLNLDLRIHV